jgi:hypothetical protein
MGSFSGQANAIHSPLRSMCLIGRNSDCNWVVQGPQGKFGGLFAERVAALKFAMFEGGTPHAAVMVPGTLELNMAQGR